MGSAVQANDHCLYCGELCLNDDEYVIIGRNRYRVKQWFHRKCYTKEEHVKCSHSRPER